MFTFRPAKRVQTPLIVGMAGPTKAGKSLSALRLATGMAGGKTIAMLNTEGPRGHMYADRFHYITADLSAPFRPTRYTEAIEEMKKLDLGCVIIDSVSHCHDGPGGILEWHEEILDRLAGKDYAKRERSTFVAWVEPKAAENQFIYALQELACPVILCLRAKEKIKISKGKVEDLGWQPIVGERVAFETIFTLMLPPHSKGVPDLSISDMREPFDSMIEPGKQIDEPLGERLAAWARGDAQESPQASNGQPPVPQPKADPTRAPESQPWHPSREQLTRLHTIKAAHHVPDEILKRKLHEDYGLDTTKALSLEQYQSVCNWLASQQPSPAPGEDVPDGLVPGSDEAWAALEERSRAVGWTGLQWQGAREHLGYADVLAEIVALEPDPTQPELA